MKLPKKTPRLQHPKSAPSTISIAHLANLNSYSVVYVEADGSKEVIKSTRIDNLTMKISKLTCALLTEINTTISFLVTCALTDQLKAKT